jgi:hypothetical protein
MPFMERSTTNGNMSAGWIFISAIFLAYLWLTYGWMLVKKNHIARILSSIEGHPSFLAVDFAAHLVTNRRFPMGALLQVRTANEHS